MLLPVIAVLSRLSDLSETVGRVIPTEARCPREGCLRSSGVVLRWRSGWPRLGIFHVISTQVAKKLIRHQFSAQVTKYTIVNF
jgi:hypothetical protein